MARLSLVLFVLASLLCCVYGQTTLFATNFDDGSLAGWVVSGDASISTLTPFSAPNSVRLQVTGNVKRTVSTVGYSTISVTLAMAATVLESSDFCYAEYSVDGGTNWAVLLSLTDGQDTGVYTLQTYNLPASASNNPNFVFRYRILGDATGDKCWCDDLTIRGVAGGSPPPPPPPPPPPTSYDDLTGSGSVTRTLLTYSQLTSGFTPASPIDSSAFTIPANAAQPTNNFQGRLVLQNEATVGQYSEIRDDYNYVTLSVTDRIHLPEFDFEFVQHGTHLIPVIDSNVRTAHPSWEYIVGPGRVWNENSDIGYSRAAFPFTLTQKNANCAHNGMMTFLFKNDQTISYVYYQVTQETCLYFKIDLWGTLGATASFYQVTNYATIQSTYATEVSNRIPVFPISQLATDYPGTGVNPSVFGSEITAAHMTAFGVFIDGKHYRGGLNTRYGAYPFPNVMVLPSYSTSKSTLVSMAALRMAQTTSGLFTQPVNNRVSQCPNTLWNGVTIGNALDMATGNYRFNSYLSDESSSAIETNFFLKLTHTDKVNFACNNWPRKVTPGTQWVYHTSDHYVVATNLQSLAGGNLVSYMEKEIFTPLQLSDVVKNPRTTYDTTAQVWGAWGFFYYSDDIVKLADFFNGKEGKIGTTQLLNYSLLKKALQRDSTDRGLPTNYNTDYDYRYKFGFFGRDLYKSTPGQCALYVPYMSGYGGINVILLPNKAVYYYFSDNDEFSWVSSALEATKLRSTCAVSYSP